jgi:hypothetical protein
MGGGNNKTPVTVKCARCGTEFTVPYYHWRNYTKAGKNFYCKECYKINRSAISKKVWKEMDPDKKKATNDKKAETRRNRSEEEKKASRIKTQNTWANKSEEEMKAHSEIRKKNTQAFWDSLDQAGHKEMHDKMSKAQRKYLDSLTDDEKDARAAKLRDASKESWANLSDEEYNRRVTEMSTLRKNEWASMSEAERDQRKKLISEGQKERWDNSPELREKYRFRFKEWWESINDDDHNERVAILHDGFKNWFRNLTEEQREEFAERMGQYTKAWWDSLSVEEYIDVLQKQAEGYQRYLESVPKANQPNENELVFQDHLNRFGFEYQFQSSNEKIHPDFNKLFPLNPITGKHVSPYHRWDYRVITLESDVLVDIDGSVHDPKNKTTGITEFNDSKRPYQTDGLPAYAVLCYDNDIKESTPVKNITTGEIMPFKAFITLLRMMNMTKKEQRKVLNL